MPIRLDVVAVDRTVYSDDVDMVIAPGIEGEMGILPRHAPLMTALNFGILVVKKTGEPDEQIAIGGGFMEVRPDRVTVLADSADRAEEVDIAQADEARRKAAASLEQGLDTVDEERALAALKRAKLQLKLAERQGGRSRRPSPSAG
ncbi:MAG: F0F1 ATP synthase subunit epsilon [Anaerolineae bacterium]|nr:F0F1 ATP synthase subunit epsilon [Anaerolineae bacterium]